MSALMIYCFFYIDELILFSSKVVPCPQWSLGYLLTTIRQMFVVADTKAMLYGSMGIRVFSLFFVYVLEALQRH